MLLRRMQHKVHTVIVVHSSAAATSAREAISPVQRFPIFRGAFRVTFAGKAETAVAATISETNAKENNMLAVNFKTD